MTHGLRPCGFLLKLSKLKDKMISPQTRFLLLRQPVKPLNRTFATSSRHCKQLELAYDLHEPPDTKKSGTKSQNAPIIFMHGLFGSKKNNRSMSK